MNQKKNKLRKISVVVGIIGIITITWACLNLTNIIQINTKKIRNLDEKEISQQEDNIEIQNTEEEKIIECESIAQGVQELNLQDGYYTLRVTGEIDGVEETVDYPIELLNFYEDIHYTESQQLGDSTADQRMLVAKYWGNLEIDSGVTVTAKTRKKGMYIHVVEKLENKGTITMTARGAKAQGQNVYLYLNDEEKYEYIPKAGGNGGDAVYEATTSGAPGIAGKQGSNGTQRRTGGGGSGGAVSGATSGKGSQGTSYSGGSGGGGAWNRTKAGDAQADGGAGGNGNGKAEWTWGVGGGAGNPGGTSQSNAAAGENGTGGLLIIYADEFCNQNTISSNGSSGGWAYRGAGGGSGGGSINILCNINTSSPTSIVQANGGAGGRGTRSGGETANGGAGGNGSITISKDVELIETIEYYLNYPQKTIQLQKGTNTRVDKAKLKYVVNVESEITLTVGKITYTSEDETIATVSATGRIQAIKEGTTRIKIRDEDNEYETYIEITVINGAKSDISMGENFTIALKENGTVWSFGANDQGQLGLGNNEKELYPKQINISKTAQIGTGYHHAVALTQTGEIYTWGDNSQGQLGKEGIENSNIPSKVEGLANIIKVDAYKNKTIALTKEGEIYAWGEEIGNFPTKINIDKEIVDISGIIALTAEGTICDITNTSRKIKANNIAKISCGSENYLVLNQKGIVSGNLIQNAKARRVLKLEERITQISTGNGASIAKTESGDIYTWGNNANGQIGQGGTATIEEPQIVTGIKAEQIEAGEGKTSAIVKEDGFVLNTGLNSDGQLGTGDTTSKTTYTEQGKTRITEEGTKERIELEESITIKAKLEKPFNIKVEEIDDNQENFIIETQADGLDIQDKTITAKKYGEYTITLTHIPTGMAKELKIKAIKEMESIVQGFRDNDLPDGKHKILVNNKEYDIELINYYDDVVYTENTELGDSTTEYKTLVVKYHKNLTIKEGVTITAKTVNNLTYKKGMYICVLGDIYNDGNISMTARGTYNQAGEDVYLWKNIDETYEYVPALGATGGESQYTNQHNRVLQGKNGNNGTGRQTGGGGTGAGRNWIKSVTIGAGGRGTSYSGGAGSGASNSDGSGGGDAVSGAGSSVGGAGSAGVVLSGNGSGYGQISLGGTGNPSGGYATYRASAINYVERRGTGGLLIIYTDNLYNSGNITAKGVESSTCGTTNSSNGRVDPGGASGGGSINIFANHIIERETITAQGGAATILGATGGAGGSGTVTINELGSHLNYPEKKITIKQNAKYQLIEENFQYIKLNEKQTENLSIGKLTYETLEPQIVTISENGEITAQKAGTTKIKITEQNNQISTYITLEVIEQETKSQIKEGNEFTIALKEDGTVWNYGKDISDKPVQIMLEEKIVDIGAGDESGIALTENGEVYTWGKHYSTGGATVYEKTPIKEPIENIKQVDSVGTNFYALDNEGNAYIWGNGYTVPTKIETNVKIVEIKGKLLLGENGRVYTIQKPTEEIKWLKNIATIAQGEDHNLFVTTDGYVYSIGKGDKGQIGNGKTAEKTTPILVRTAELEHLKNIVEISAGSKTSMALTLDGKAYVWGDNTDSKLGIEGENVVYATQITKLQNKEGTALELNKITNIETGKNHSTISDENGYVYSVGLNTNGQLGTEDTENKTIYTQIEGNALETNKDEIRIGIGEKDTIIAKLKKAFNLKTILTDENQDNFRIEVGEQENIAIEGMTITGLKYGKVTVTVRHSTNMSKNIQVKVVKEMESIVQGFRDEDMPDGTHEISVNGEDYTVEVINYYDDMIYTENTELGDDTTEHKTLVVKYHKNLTVKEGVTLTAKAVDNLTYKKGMYICVLGDIYNDGNISMTARGTYNCEGQNVYLWKNIDNSYEYVPAVGGLGGEAITYTNDKIYATGDDYFSNGKEGKKGINRATGGGGSGGMAVARCDYSSFTMRSGAGATGTSFSGGSGGGSINTNYGGIHSAEDGAPNGGAGGAAFSARGGTSWASREAGGGAGNTGGAGQDTYSGQNIGTNNTAISGENGTGGLLILYANNLYNTGNISSKGSSGGAAHPGGGSSGGGSINIFAKIVEEHGTQEAKGGISAGYFENSKGGAGGNGSITINEVSSLLNYPEKKITIKESETYQLKEEKISYVKLNEIQTEDLSMGKLTYETLSPEIATISETGEITAKKAGTTKIKITDQNNELSTYIIIEVIDQVAKSQIKEGNEFTLVLKEDGTVWSYGKDISSEPVQIALEEKIVDIGAGNESSIALTENGEVYTWGRHYGEGGATVYEKTPIKEQIENIKQVDSVGTNFYALDNEGKVYIWGNGYTVPTKIETQEKIVQISGKLLLGENGKVYTTEKPTEEIKCLKNIATIEQGEDHSLFVTTTGHIHSIGKGEKGQLGNGKTEEKGTPTLVKTEQGYLQNVIAVSAGSKTSMALTLDGKAYVWGDNTDSKLGIEGENVVYATQITKLQNKEGTALELNKITNIETGKNHSTISDENGYVYSVGLNTNGQLGTEDTENKTIYTQIGKPIITTNKEEYRVGLGESQTIIAKLQDSFNLKNNAIDENQNNFSIEQTEQQKITINDKTITGIQYGETTLTIKHKNNITKDVKVKVIKDMESIVQGFRDTDLPDGTHEISINGEDYTIELINYYDDMTYTENTELGDNSTEYKTLVVKYHKNLTINEDVTLTAKQVDNLTYKKGMYICVLGDIHNEGTISMTARGTYNYEGQNVYLWKNIDDSYEYVPAVGGSGGESRTYKNTSLSSPLNFPRNKRFRWRKKSNRWWRLRRFTYKWRRLFIIHNDKWSRSSRDIIFRRFWRRRTKC